MTDFCLTEKCFGCGACAQICPKKCITMKYNEYGFLAPHIDKNSCINCGLCKKVCPAINFTYKLQTPQKILCATLKEQPEILKKSSSGGFAYVLAKSIIEQGGVTFGAVYDENLKVKHQILKTEQDLSKAQGSKYVQSDINICYQEAKKYLQEGKQVLFVGTPCQIAGLYGYLQNTPQDKLLTCDLLCGGAPSPKLFKHYISYLEGKYKNKIVHFNFRSKRYGYGYLHLIATTQHNKNILLTGIDASFIRTLGLGYVRDSCFNCPFRSTQRIADITAGDFWNLLVSEKQFEQGLSLGLINTKKAEEFISKYITPQMQISEHKIKDLQDSQSVSIRPIKKKPADYEEFFTKVWQMDWPEITKKYIYPKSSFKQNLMDSIPPVITSALRKIIRRISIWRKQKAK